MGAGARWKFSDFNDQFWILFGLLAAAVVDFTTKFSFYFIQTWAYHRNDDKFISQNDFLNNLI